VRDTNGLQLMMLLSLLLWIRGWNPRCKLYRTAQLLPAAAAALARCCTASCSRPLHRRCRCNNSTRWNCCACACMHVHTFMYSEWYRWQSIFCAAGGAARAGGASTAAWWAGAPRGYRGAYLGGGVGWWWWWCGVWGVEGGALVRVQFDETALSATHDCARYPINRRSSLQHGHAATLQRTLLVPTNAIDTRSPATHRSRCGGPWPWPRLPAARAPASGCSGASWSPARPWPACGCFALLVVRCVVTTTLSASNALLQSARERGWAALHQTLRCRCTATAVVCVSRCATLRCCRRSSRSCHNIPTHVPYAHQGGLRAVLCAGCRNQISLW